MVVGMPEVSRQHSKGKCARKGTALAVVLASCLATASQAQEPQTIDDLGFGSVMDENLFSSGFSVGTSSSVPLDASGKSRMSTQVEIESEPGDFGGSIIGGFNLDSVTDGYQSQGLRIRRLSTTFETESGALTVGSDWANFQDTLAAGRTDFGFSAPARRSVAKQVKWLSPNGFSIALEDENPLDNYTANYLTKDQGVDPSQNLILSWQGGPGGVAGEYKITAMGTRFDAEDSGQELSSSDLTGWGLNLEGGWQIGELFAALSVTYGRGIDSYLLQRMGNELIVTPNEVDGDNLSYAIRPSLYYSLNSNSNFHVALGRYSAEDSNNLNGVDTLDTIHMGYSWSPWPSTRFGLELVGQNADGPRGSVDDTRVRFGAQKNF